MNMKVYTDENFRQNFLKSITINYYTTKEPRGLALFKKGFTRGIYMKEGETFLKGIKRWEQEFGK